MSGHRARHGEHRFLRDLVLPVYLPSFIYSIGTSALLPAQVLLALQLGFTATQVALIATWVGAFAVFSSLSAGYLVQWLGEARVLTPVTAIGVLGLLGTCWSALAGWGSARWVLIVALTLFDLVDAVWSIARQGLVADAVRAEQRGRAMNVYGASQRMGRVVGPLVAAAVLALAGPAHVFVVSAAVVSLSTLLLLRFLPRRPAATTDPRSQSSDSHQAMQKRAMRGLVILGVGVLVLSALRMGKESLIPLWGAHFLGLPDQQVALVAGVASAMELALFWPAGLAMDRLGRMPVVVTCLTLMGVGLIAMPWGSGTGWFVGTAVLVGLGDGVGAGIIKTLGIDLAPANGRGRFLGLWQSVASVGSFVAPAVSSAIIAVSSLAVVLPVVGVLGLAAALWMAYWTPRFVPRRADPWVTPSGPAGDDLSARSER